MSYYLRFLFILSLLLVGVRIPTSAQNALSEDEQALLQRAWDAVAQWQNYQSYEYSSRMDLAQTVSGGIGDQLSINDVLNLRLDVTQAITYLEGGANVQQHYRLDAAQSTLDPTQQTDYVLEADTRQVDGVVYVNAAYTEPGPGQQAVPTGWFIYGDQDTPAVDSLRLDGLGGRLDRLALGQLFGVFGGNALAEVEQIFQTQATAITSESGVLEDGTPIERIQFTLTTEGLQALWGLFDRQDMVEEFLLAQLLSATPLTYTLILDTDGNLVGVEHTIDFNVTDLDISSLVNAPGFTLTVMLQQTVSARFTSINADLEVVAAPEDVARPTITVQSPVEESPWWNDHVFYEIFVRSFYDSNGDGNGDLQGIIEKLDYLNDGDPTTATDLGITGIWLMPIMASPTYHGYDATDYYTVNPDYGTNADFQALIAAAHERGIAVIVDLVLNHTSTEHPWFTASAEGDPEYADWYIWSDNDPGWIGPWGQQVWYPANGRYYFALFWSGMPDLNYNNPEVTAQMYDVARFWLEDMGADGFRLDAIRHIFEAEINGQPAMENVPATYTWLADFQSYIETVNPDVFTVGEAWDTTEVVLSYLAADDINVAFEFDLAANILASANAGTNYAVRRQHIQIVNNYPPGQYATFLTNHDQNRVMSQLNGDVGANKAAATLLLTSPGVPFIYYGEEIGMTGVKPDEDIRTPMQWGIDCPAACFSTTLPWESLTPGYRTTVFTEQANPDSLWQHYRTLIQLRNEHAALRTGVMLPLTSTNPAVYGFLRYDDEETLLVVVNLGRETVSDYALLLFEEFPLTTVTEATWIMGEGDLAVPDADGNGVFRLYKPLAELPPQSSFIIELH